MCGGITAAAGFIIVASVAGAATRYVAPGGATIAPYDSWAKAASNIQIAVDAAVDGETVLVAEGVYDSGGRAPGGIGYTTVNRVVIDKGILVLSSNGPANTIIVGKGPLGAGAVRCAYVSSNGVLSGFTLRDGAVSGGAITDARGGGVLIDEQGCLSN
jgi:hypothetical protein